MSTRYASLINQKFNSLTITGIHHKNKNSQYFLSYRCECGKEGVMLGSAIVNGYNKSCGCALKKQFQSRIDALIGKHINKILIQSFAHMGNKGKRYMNCVCECGNKCILSMRQIQDMGSCGCTTREKHKLKNTKHGMYYTKIYKVYDSIKQRCANPNNRYYRLYGGRGIKNTWASLEDFLQDMGSSYSEGLSIDRIDPNGNYCKENCRWIKLSQQQRNKTNTRYIKKDGIILPAITIAEEEGITVRDVLKKYSRCDIEGNLVDNNL